MKQPFVHVFSCSLGYFLYDVNSDNILKISKESAEILKKGTEFNYQLKILEEAGYLKSNRVQISEHPAGPLLEKFYQNGLKGLTLQVTQNCNLRCSYCVYSGLYNTRTHSNKRMSFELAKKGIDYLLDHSQDTEELRIGFYGGEPLLEYELICKCVNYITQHANGKKINYYITTNATLLTQTIINFLVQNNFTLTISFDGPKDIHDSQRRFVNTNKGSFDVVISNLQFIKEHFPCYFKQNVNLNMVLNPENQYKKISDFIKGENLFQDLSISATLISNLGKKEKNTISSTFREEYYYEFFKVLLCALGRFDKKNISPLLKTEFNTLTQIRKGKQYQGLNILPKKWHHGGPCIPGERTIFLNVDGDFYPCERVCENKNVASIGNINDGIDVRKAQQMLNIEQATTEMCKNCWAYQYCDFCIRLAGPEENSFLTNVLEACEGMKLSTENLFLDYCVLKELGYDFETETSHWRCTLCKS